MLDGVRVLLVDDDKDSLDIYVLFLERYGTIVTPTCSARAALEAFDRGRFDVLVSDVGMPDEDGNALIRAVRAMGPDRGGDVPAIAVTAWAFPRDVAAALSAGFDRHVSKPCEPHALAEIVAEMLGRAGGVGA